MPNGSENDYSKLSWAEWKGQAGEKLRAMEQNEREIFHMLGKLREEVAFLKGKAAAYGAAAGAAVSAVVELALKG